MSSRDLRPKWWQLYLTFPLLMALFAVDNRLKISTRGHIVVQIGIVLLVYGLWHLWLNANATALSKTDQRPGRGRITVIRIPLYQMPESKDEKRLMFEFPDSEIIPALSDTLEMDYIDTESFPIDAVSQELDNE